MNKSVRNNLYLILFCGITGAVAGGVIWTFLKMMSVGTAFLGMAAGAGSHSLLYRAGVYTGRYADWLFPPEIR